ncbi:hypothetical protein Tco_0947185, partial [Tanacetum coccineum]
PPPPPAAAATTSGSSNHRRQQQPPAATLQLTAVNRSQLQSTEVNRSQPKSTAVNHSGVFNIRALMARLYYGQLEEIMKLTYIGNQSDQDVIHGSSSSNVTLSVELTNFEHTNLSINSKSTEVDAPPVNDDNANANEGNAEDDDVAHVLDDDE